MAKPCFTPAQQSAILTRDKTLLVSAAAGSGKTATLTERIIRSLTDRKNPEDISRMLIVTFTNAAVADLKEKISKALREAIAENPNDEHLLRQLYALPGAHISTIDSFCNEILKSNCERFGISPKYRIADPIEAELLATSVCSTLIDAAYNGEISGISPEDFEELTVSLTGVKNNSSLEEAFSFLYEKAKDHENGVEIFKSFAKELGNATALPVEENVYCKYAIRKTKEFAAHYRKVILDFMTKLCGSADKIEERLEKANLIVEKYKEAQLLSGKEKKAFLEALPDISADDKYLTVMEKDFAILDRIMKSESYADMLTALDVSFEKMPTVSDKTELQLAFAAVRDKIKDTLKRKHKERYFSYSEQEWRAHLYDMQKLTSILARFIEEFDRVYFNEKKSRSMLEYSDIERLTYLSLYDECGEPSELARSLREEFTSVYIDEYQDVNLIQNKIFLAISKKNNRFTVGDIKQSIYVFRNARPEIFAEMKNAYPALADAKDSDTASIFMSENFRCDEGIIDFANNIFDEMFTLVGESIGYVESDKLKFAKKYDGDTPPYRTPELHLFANEEDTEGEEDEDELLPSERSAKWIAEKIRSLLSDGTLNSGNSVKPCDIAIILRKDQGRAEIYKKEIESLGIPVRAPQSRDFFLNSEIQLVLCLLNAINNPTRDIYLAGLMLSPIFDFTPDELYLARRLGGRTLYHSIKAFSEANPENTKFSYFISALDRYRKISEGMQVDALIMRLYNETGLLALAKNDGSCENLMLLYNYAKKYEESSFKGLYSFINYVNGIIDAGKTFSASKDTDDENAVTIITAHKSKGLEFPIVFLADASVALISANERKGRIAYSETYGLGMKKRITGGLALVESPIRNVIIDSNIEKSLEEELRVYYVAVTRAREALYVVGSPKAKTKEDFLEKSRYKKIAKSTYSLTEMTSFVDILHFVDTDFKVVWHDSVSEFSTVSQIDEAENAPQSEDYDEQLYRKALSSLTFKYPRQHLTTLPEKMSISRLYPTVLDGLDTEESLGIDEPKAKQRPLGITPTFFSGKDEMSSAKRGIATHTFLQFFDAERLDALGVEGELNRLVEKGFISKEDARRVRIEELSLFSKSKLLSDMKKAKKLYREFRFNVMLPAPMFTENKDKKEALSSETILLQGVIDCIIIDEDDSLHLVDYKTDRLTEEELSDKALAKKTLSERHSLQLSYYSCAVEKIFGHKPCKVSVYSLPLGDTVEIDIANF